MNSRTRRITGVKFAIALIAAILFMIPFFLVILNSIKPLDQIMTELLELTTGQKYTLEEFGEVGRRVTQLNMVSGTISP